MIVCARWASALPEGLVKQTCSISTSLWWWCVGFPFICFPFIYIHTRTSAYSHVHTALGHTHVSCDRTGVSSEFFVCSLSRCHTQTHHTCVFLHVCVCSLLLLRICTRTRCVGFVWVEKVENNDGFSCLSGRSRQDVRECVRVFVSLRCSDALTHKGKHFLLLYFAVLATPSFISLKISVRFIALYYTWCCTLYRSYDFDGGLNKQNSVWNRTSRKHSDDCFCLHTTYMPHDYAFFKYKMEFVVIATLNVHMTVRADISHSFICYNVARPNRVAGCKALPKDSHSITLIYRGAVRPFHSLFLSSVSPSSHCPPQLPNKKVQNPCSPISISKGEVSPRELRRENFLIIMTRIILVLFDKAEFAWGLIELFFIGFALVLSIRSSTDCKSLYHRRFFSAFRCQNCDAVLCTILIWRTGLGTQHNSVYFPFVPY